MRMRPIVALYVYICLLHEDGRIWHTSVNDVPGDKEGKQNVGFVTVRPPPCRIYTNRYRKKKEEYISCVSILSLLSALKSFMVRLV